MSGCAMFGDMVESIVGMTKTAKNLSQRMDALGVWVLEPPGRPEEPSKINLPKSFSKAQEVMHDIDQEFYLFECGKFNVRTLFSIESAFFRYPPDSEQRAVLLEFEKFQRLKLSRHPIGRCCILPGETAFQAKMRSLKEAMESFPIRIMNYGDWYREFYLHSEHWLRLRKDAILTSGGYCCECGKVTTLLQVHHEEYRNIFDVELDDLACLCGPCHKAEHGLVQDRTA